MKKFIVILLLAALLLPAGVHADFASDARALYDLKLLKGTGDSFSMEALDPDRNATRAEACITLLRMLGKEEKANYQANPHPFADVPAWASACVGWLYENWIVNGVSDTYFGAQDIATVQQFSAMTLRALGFNEQDGDFAYADAVNKAVSVGLFDASVAAKYELSRRDMITIIARAMRTNLNNANRKLIDKLCDEGAVDRGEAERTGFLRAATLSDVFADIPETLGAVTVSADGDHLTLRLATPAEHYGLRVFYTENGGPCTELPFSGFPRFEKGDISYIGGSAAGYVSELSVYGLDMTGTYSFIVLKTTSESEFYTVTGKSAVADRRTA